MMPVLVLVTRVAKTARMINVPAPQDQTSADVSGDDFHAKARPMCQLFPG
jgi:hypothetical protein